MTTLTAADAKRELFELVEGALAKHEVYRIDHQQGCAVLLSEDEYEGLLETLELLSIPGFRESIQRSVHQMESGDTLSMAEVLGEEE